MCADMEAWIWISIAAAAFQTLRFMLQKTLSMGVLSATGATFARFVYALPFVWALVAGYLLWAAAPVALPGGRFWFFGLAGALAQILATVCVVLIFATRNFAVGITFKKTEVIQTALVGLLILGDRVSAGGMVAIVIGLVGVLVLSDPPGGEGRWITRLLNRAAGLGLMSGAFFALSAVFYRGATLEVVSDDALMRAALTLVMVTTAQAAGMALWLCWREPGELGRVWRARRTAIWMGAASMAGSLSWFTAFTLQNAAYVFAVGQVEVIFSLMASVLFFREKVSGRELIGIGLLTASILVLVVLR